MTATPLPVVWITDLEGNQVGAIRNDLVALWHDERADQSETFGLTVPLDHPKADLLIEDAELYFDGRRFRISEVVDERDGAAIYRRVEAEALWYELGDVELVGTRRHEGNAVEALDSILAQSRWTRGPATVATGGDWVIEETDQSWLSMLRTFAKVSGLGLRFDTSNRTVDLLENRGRALGLAYRYRRNITSHVRRRRRPQITVLYPIGADDLTIAGVNGGDPKLEDYSYYTGRGLTSEQAAERFFRRQVWVDTSFVREADLLAGAQRRLAALSQDRVSYEVKVVDLSSATGIPEDVHVYDEVRVSDPDFGADLRADVVRIYRDYLNPADTIVELSFLGDPLDDDADTAGRPASTIQWDQFVGPVRAAYQIRNDGDYIVARLPIRFRENGRANFHVDIWATGVGAGTMHVTVIDSENGDELQRRQVDVPYTDGELVRADLDWAREELSGAKDYRVKVTTTASGGPSSSAGVDIAADLTDEASFYAMVQGAVLETPVEENTVRFDYVSDAAQSWTVPDNVEEVTVTVVGASGGGGANSTPGAGGSVSCKFAVVPGTAYDIYAPRKGGDATGGAGEAGWPGPGGIGGTGGQPGGGGGGYAAIIPAGSSLASALVVAAGGGGVGENANSGNAGGGAGGYLQGGDGQEIFADLGGHGATQSAGGARGTLYTDGADGGFGFGGDGASGGSFHEGGGGGGAGWYGGGGGSGNNVASGGGGGGSGYISPAIGAYQITLADGANTGNGYVELSWDTPLDDI